MKATPIHLALSGLVLVSSLSAETQLMIERLDHYTQTSSAAPTALASGEYQFQVRLVSNGHDLTSWAPVFYKPGSGGVPDTSPSADTNTGTANFSTTPNDGADYRFQHNFNDAASLLATYPTGGYGVVFGGLGGTTITAGLSFDTAGFVQPPPQVTTADNRAYWIGTVATGDGHADAIPAVGPFGSLAVQAFGPTQLGLNTDTFTTYDDSPFGALIQISLYDACGQLVDFQQSINIPGIDNQEMLTHYTLDGASLVSGASYTLEIQYGLLASAPALTTLDGADVISGALYYTHTDIAVWVAHGAPIPEPATTAALCGSLMLGAAAFLRRRRAAS